MDVVLLILGVLFGVVAFTNIGCLLLWQLPNRSTTFVATIVFAIVSALCLVGFFR